VPNLEDQRILLELVQQRIEIVAILVGVLEGDRELHQHGAEHVFVGDGVQTRFGQVLIVRAGMDGVCRRGLDHGYG
jgi:hypothetical protein